MILVSVPVVEQKFSSVMAKVFRKLVKKAMFAPKEHFRGLLLKRNYWKFCTTSEIFWTSREMFSSRLSELRYPIPAEKFDDGYSSKKTSSSFSDIEWIRSWFLSNYFSFVGVVTTAFNVFKGTFWAKEGS